VIVGVKEKTMYILERELGEKMMCVLEQEPGAKATRWGIVRGWCR
jgi:hypothetical protein